MRGDAMLSRGLQVLEAFTPERPALTMVEVAERVGVHRAAARRYLLALTELGYLRAEPVTNRSGSMRWRLTPRVLRLGYSCLAGLNVWQIVQPALADLAAASGLSSSAAILDAPRDALVVAHASSNRLLRLELPPGTRLRADATALGRVLLAGLPAAELDGWLQALPPGTDATRLRRQLLLAAARGYAEQDGELEAGLWAMAVPVRRGTRVIAAVDVAGHAGDRPDAATLDRKLLPALRATSAVLGEALGAHPAGGTALVGRSTPSRVVVTRSASHG